MTTAPLTRRQALGAVGGIGLAMHSIGRVRAPAATTPEKASTAAGGVPLAGSTHCSDGGRLRVTGFTP